MNMVNSETELTWQVAKELVEKVIFNTTGKYLSDVEKIVLKGAWDRQTYDEIAETHNYTADYLTKDVGHKLWRKLSDGLQESVNKNNFRGPLERASSGYYSAFNGDLYDSLSTLSFPDGSVPPDSPFYVEREGVDTICQEAIAKPGALIRIKAPKLMGKTSLVVRLCEQARSRGERVVYVDLDSIEKSTLTHLDRFLRWLCWSVERELKLESQLKAYWDAEILGSNDNCTVYFEEYLLSTSEVPLVLAFDNVDRIFPYPEVVEDFLGMLRSWHEKGKIYPIWKQLRLILAHSTECYIPLDLNQSPFNAGIPVELKEFGQKQVESLAHLYGLKWEAPQIQDLMQLLGGHPYLVRLAIYEIGARHMTWEELVQKAPTEEGIYSSHLRRHLMALQQSPALAQSLKKVVSSPDPVSLNSLDIYKLHSMGLIRERLNQVVPTCNLYREYFQRVLEAENSPMYVES
jgi:hypothetical protein